MKIIDKIKTLYRNHYWSLEKLARYNGCEIGTGCFIGSKFWSSEPYLIKIGNNCAITSGVKIFTHGGARVMRHKYPNFDCFGKVTLGNYVYLGSNTLVLPGVEIGDNVLVAAGSVVTKSIPSGVVVAGNPAKFVCTIEDYEKNNLKYNTNSKGLNAEEKRKFLLNLDEEKFIKKKYLNINK